MVWEGRSREAPPYPDRWHIADPKILLKRHLAERVLWNGARAVRAVAPRSTRCGLSRP